ncbi:HlyD family efflux transporter periplasmic adaptor subunit [Aeromonas rivipollensis]|uniref:HlyD family efflux transporter periplasmic adaptor subunit n=1 Tax=Aeromonas rivipollensis TaxID=948519 RepID=A0ABX0D8N0_9GAMM|nr:efflux RND transporter periplasmic adaptor subunit [Aeromonas rivipollensis]NEX90959.1 HlyD family efflux transporter periplasmic adaptor subunit [Aeromonas rivipollensis]NEY08004.1 HlyD family efflux transporter periplasmic adaptor subunit [Aeromonas rivipollensis]
MSHPPIKKKMSQGKPWLLPLALALLVIWLGWRFWLAYQPEPVRLQGQIEAQQYAVSSKVAGRIDEVLVKKGDQLAKGQLAFTLASPEIEAKLSQAKAGQAAAGAMAQEAEKGARAQQIAAAKDQWQQAKAAALLRGKTYERIASLHRDGVMPLQKRDEAWTALQAAKYSEGMAWQQYQMTLEGAREETKVAAREQAKMAAGGVAEVEAYLADTRIASPHEGEVAQVLLRSGELAPQGFPVVTLLDMKDAWAQFHIREDLLPRFPVGTEFDARIPGLGDQTVRFKVAHVAAMGDFATWRATDTRQGFDMKSFQVEARPLQPVEGLRVGMSVLVEL